MSWKPGRLQGEIAGIGIDEWFRTGFELAEERLEGGATSSPLVPEALRPYLSAEAENVLMLPISEKVRQDDWQAALSKAKVAFGRGGLALTLSSLREGSRPVRLVGADSQSGRHILSLDLIPDPRGVGIRHSAMDGRPGSHNDLVALLKNAQSAVPEIEVLVCPDYPRGKGFERLLPFLDSLSTWSRPELRWEFPEQLLPSCGVVGGIWNLYWLLDGYRLGEWQQPGGLLSLDEDSALAGVTLVAPACGAGESTDWLTHRPGPVLAGAPTT
ncbi:hypothetical protein QQM79_03465 [Marinobacteraceae bacterium S3BR75-40.1]